MPRRHGVSTLGKIFRRPIVFKMTTDGNSNSSFLAADSTDSMKAACTMIPGRRALSSSPRPRPTNLSKKTWQPGKGIIFQPSSGPGTPRMETAAALSLDIPIPNSKAEDSYILVDRQLQATNIGLEQRLNEAEANVIKTEDSTSADQEALGEVPLDLKYDLLPEPAGEWEMPEELFRAAKNAPLESTGSYWSYQLYRGPVLERETTEATNADTENPERKVTVHYCRSKHTTEQILQKYFMNEKVIGFDIEWLQNAHKNLGPKKNVSLIQIASEERIALFHIALYTGNGKEDLVAPSLRKIMEDPNVTKVGVAIKGDCTRLKNNLNIKSRGIFELSHLFKLVKFCELKEYKQINKKLISLATQVQEHLHLPMFKGGDVRSSDWSKALNLEQIRYAASDSYAGVQLYQIMDMKRKALDPTPPLPYHAELDIPIRTTQGIEIPTDDTADDQEEEEPEVSIVKKRKYVKKAVPYYSPNSTDFEFDDRQLEAALSSKNFPEACSRALKTKSQFKQSLSEAGLEEPSACLGSDPDLESLNSESDAETQASSSSFHTALDSQYREFEAEDADTVTRIEDQTLELEEEALDLLGNINTATLLDAANLHALAHLTTSASSTPPTSNSAQEQSSLITFYLWYLNPDLTLSQIASILRSPPVSMPAVIRHILEVANSKGNGIEYENSRVRGVLGTWKELGFSSELWVDLEKRVSEDEAS